jgi:lipopolysaccharide/colanic/teichoic acid biosynthesis glycosyltransferase
MKYSTWPQGGRTRGTADGHMHRAVDVLLAGAASVALSPVIGLLALAVRADSRGPATYAGVRVGHHGRPFRMLKFRKMHHAAAGSPLTSADDARYTRIGRLLSRLKLDELPQLVNVLTGDMALVGPRPEHPDFVRARPHEFAQVLSVPPGITGLSQVVFRDEFAHLVPGDEEASYLEQVLPIKLRIDGWYAGHRSTALDLRILWWTAVALTSRRTPAGAQRLMETALADLGSHGWEGHHRGDPAPQEGPRPR